MNEYEIVPISSSIPAEPSSKRRRLAESVPLLPPLPAGIRIIETNNNLTSKPEVTLPSPEVNEDEVIFVTPPKKPAVTLVDLTEDSKDDE